MYHVPCSNAASASILTSKLKLTSTSTSTYSTPAPAPAYLLLSFPFWHALCSKRVGVRSARLHGVRWRRDTATASRPRGACACRTLRDAKAEANVSAIDEPFLVIRGVDMDGSDVGPLRVWQRNEGDISAGCSYVVRGLKVVHDRAWDTTRGCYVRSSDQPLTVECSPRTACEDVTDVESITQYWLAAGLGWYSVQSVSVQKSAFL